MNPASCRFSPLGDCAVLIEFSESSIAQTNEQAHALRAHLQDHPVSGVTDLVAAYTTLAVHYDPLQVLTETSPGGSPFALMVTRLRAALSSIGSRPPKPGRGVEIPVCYGGECGEDLDALARAHSVTATQVIELHCAPEYRVLMLGFAPGFAYLGGLDARLVAPRRAAPRTKVPAGSVGIGGEQTGVYPVESPGGWNLIGRTPLKMFDATRTPPCLLSPGDRVKFVSITRAQFDSWQE